jgi:hypothetical protein
MEETQSYIHSHEYHHLKKVKLNKAISMQGVKNDEPQQRVKEAKETQTATHHMSQKIKRTHTETFVLPGLLCHRTGMLYTHFIRVPHNPSLHSPRQRRQIPMLQRPVHASADEPLAIRRKCHAGQAGGVSHKALDELPRLNIP